MISVHADGSPLRSVPVIADFGDVLPFLEHAGERAVVDEQLRLASPHLWRGLYRREGRVRLFLNHDWLLGLLDLARQRPSDPDLLSRVRLASRTVRERFTRRGFLVDERIRTGPPVARLWPASPFNLGFAELWADEARLSGDPTPLAWAEELGHAWVQTRTFKRHGVFEAQHALRSPAFNRPRQRLGTMRARLFKDNTAAVWGLLALAEATGDGLWRDALSRWVEGFARSFFNAGMPCGFVDRRLRGYGPSLKAAFASVDLLMDLHAAGIGEGRPLDLAREIAAVWRGHQWENGLFPETPGAHRDHLDANVDMAVALTKLAAHAPDEAGPLAEAASRCARGVIAHHAVPAGYALAVDTGGRVVDGTVKVKYQALVTKLALLPEDPADLLRDPGRLALLRDR